MKRFADLCLSLEGSAVAAIRQGALVRYFTEGPDQDRLWALALLCGKRPKACLNAKTLQELLREQCDMADWMIQACKRTTGDLTETLLLLLPEAGASPDQASGLSGGLSRSLSASALPSPMPGPMPNSSLGLAASLEILAQAKSLPEPERNAALLGVLHCQDPDTRRLLARLATGNFRQQVPLPELSLALSAICGVPPWILTQRLSAPWQPEKTRFQSLCAPGLPEEDIAPLPFRAIEGPDQAAVGAPPMPDVPLHVSWAWPGLAVQLVYRQGRLGLWSETGALLTDKVPELHPCQDFLPPDTLIEGLLVRRQAEAPTAQAGSGAVLGSREAVLTRLKGKSVTLAAARKAPLALLVQDLPRLDGKDLRDLPLRARLQAIDTLMENLPAQCNLQRSCDLAPPQTEGDQDAMLLEARRRGALGLMLRAFDSDWAEGRSRLVPCPALSLRAVLLYTRGALARPETLELSFGLWSGNALVPVGWTRAPQDGETRRALVAWIKGNTVERFGPSRQLPAQQVFTLAFDRAEASSRHKAGLILQGLRPVHWDEDVDPQEADRLSTAQALLPGPA